jgi:signal transduction histidine kinase
MILFFGVDAEGKSLESIADPLSSWLADPVSHNQVFQPVQKRPKVTRDITERRMAEAALQQAQATMIRSQKLEAIGQLTGGVAHDFNNLLQVISGNLQLLSKDVAGNARAEVRVQTALAGVTRGSKLASQLLAFARRQPLEPKVVMQAAWSKMLRRALGGEIEVETVVAGGLWNSLIDPDQFENAVLNLAINARDGMNGQGWLTIEASNAFLDEVYVRQHDELAAGQYVMIAVTDTGTGIPPDILERVYEPFFTTKAEDKGTGLGLAMVYGFLKQSGGHVKIYSEVGAGTTVKLCFPRQVANEDALVAAPSGEIKGGEETVLVVEDDDESGGRVFDAHRTRLSRAQGTRCGERTHCRR